MNTEVMEKKLYDACLEGDVETLEILIKGDKLTLARVSLSSTFNQTPLHLASMLGHLEFVKSLLSYKPDVTKNLDLQGRSALHLASANGYPDIVKLLIEYDEDMCRLCDEDGRTPLHLAVFKGQEECVRELLEVDCESDQERTMLHLCIKYNRLNVLISIIESNDQDLSNIKQDDGNTLLHSATALGRMQIIKYLVNSGSGVNLNSVNENGLTALDMIEQMPKDVKIKDMREFLISAGALRAQQTQAGTAIDLMNSAAGAVANSKMAGSGYTKLLKMWQVLKSSSLFRETEKEKDDTLLVGASVVAAMAYAAAICPPGGVASMDAILSSNTDPSLDAYYLPPGASLLAYFWPGLSNLFWIANTISFVNSLTVIVLYLNGAMKTKTVVAVTRLFMWMTLTAMTTAYVCAVVATSPKYASNNRSVTYKHNKTILALSVLVFAWNVIIIGNCCWALLTFLGDMKKKVKANETGNKIYAIEAGTATSTTPSNNIV